MALHPSEGVAHAALVLQEAVEHVARQAQVHAAFPVVERLLLGEDTLHQLLGPHLQVEHRVGHQRDAVQIAQPLLIHAAHEIAGH